MRFDVSVILRTAVPILLGLVLGAALAAAAGAAEPSKVGMASHNQAAAIIDNPGWGHAGPRR